MPILLSSKLGPDVLMEKIREKTDVEGFWPSVFGSNPFIGRFKKNDFQLRKRIYYRNSFIPVFYGRVGETPQGSEIRGEFRMALSVRIFMGFWFSFVGLAFIPTLFLLTRPGVPYGKIWLGLLGLLAMLALGMGMVKFGQWLARGHIGLITQYLEGCAQGSIQGHEDYRTKTILAPKYWAFELLVRRTLAFLWDTVIPAIPTVLWPAFHDSPSQDLPWWLFLPCFFLYENVVAWVWGRGLGENMARLQVRSLGGGKLAPGLVALRSLVKVVCLIPLYAPGRGDYGWAVSAALFLAPYLFTRNRCCLHDIAANSKVVLQD